MKRHVFIIGIFLCIASSEVFATPNIAQQLMSLERWKVRLQQTSKQLEETQAKKHLKEEFQREINQYLEDIRTIKGLIEKAIRSGDKIQMNEIQFKVEKLRELVTAMLDRQKNIFT